MFTINDYNDPSAINLTMGLSKYKVEVIRLKRSRNKVSNN